MSDPFIAQTIMFAGNFAPRSWAYCDGSLLPISSNTALFALIGTIYGGDGRTTMALPDLRGRIPIGPRQGPGLSSYREGDRGGAEQVALNATQIPPHAHNVQGHNGAGDETNPVAGSFLANSSEDLYAESAEAEVAMGATTNAGGGQAHENRQPFLAINFIICLQGVFPSRS